MRGFSYDRRDVTGRWLANAYAQTVGSIFSEHQKPFEVELCVAEVSGAGAGGVGTAVGADQLYRISYDGSIVDERRFVVMGGATEPVITALTASFTAGWDLPTALAAAVKALGTAGEGAPRELLPAQLEVAVLDRTLAGRTFRRVQGAALAALLAGPAPDRSRHRRSRSTSRTTPPTSRTRPVRTPKTRTAARPAERRGARGRADVTQPTQSPEFSGIAGISPGWTISCGCSVRPD